MEMGYALNIRSRLDAHFRVLRNTTHTQQPSNALHNLYYFSHKAYITVLILDDTFAC